MKYSGILLALLLSLSLLSACTQTVPEPVVLEKHYCLEDQRGAQYCLAVHNPVCGIQSNCKNNCGTTYENGCLACQPKYIEYWIEGACEVIREQ